MAAKRAAAPIAQKAGTRDFKSRRVLVGAQVRCFWSEPSLVARPRRCLPRTAPQHGSAARGRADTGTATGARRLRRSSATIRSIAVRGNQRLEPETIRSYANLSPGQTYTAETLDQALKDLYATAALRRRHYHRRRNRRPRHRRPRKPGDQPHHPRGQQAPQGRQDHSRDQARAAADLHPLRRPRGRRPDLELYRRQGRFAARVEPKIVQLDQNRVDVVFEIYEGDLAKVRAINIIGNKEFRRRAPAQGDVHPPGGRGPRLPQVQRYLRSGPACRRPAEASRLLPDPGLCRLPRRLGACRAHPRPARLRHHLCRRGRAALQIRHGRRRQRAARLPRRDDQADRQAADRRLVQRQGGRRRGDRPQRGGRQPRLRVRRHQPRLDRDADKR